MVQQEIGRKILRDAFPDTMVRLYVIESIIDAMGTAHRLGKDDAWLALDYFDKSSGYPQNATIRPHFSAVLAYIRSL